MVGWTKYLAAHVMYLKQQIKIGNLIVSGPGEDDHKRQAILVFAVPDKKQLLEIIQKDPYYKHDLITEMTITPWNPQFGSIEE